MTNQEKEGHLATTFMRISLLHSANQGWCPLQLRHYCLQMGHLRNLLQTTPEEGEFGLALRELILQCLMECERRGPVLYGEEWYQDGGQQGH